MSNPLGCVCVCLGKKCKLYGGTLKKKNGARLYIKTVQSQQVAYHMSFPWTHSACYTPSPNETIINDWLWLWSHLSWICMLILNRPLNRYICNILKRIHTFAQYLHLSNEFVISFLKFIFNWRIISLQYYIGFCPISICTLSLESPSHPTPSL